MSIFGIIVSGRLVQTNFVQTDPAKFVVDIPQADGINHIVVFLTGASPLPDGTGGQIYFSWPDPHIQVAWHLLGFISNDKPSAIFKISNLKKTSTQDSSMIFGVPGQFSTHNAQIGISIEPLVTVLSATPAATATPSSTSSFTEYTEKMLQNFYNYVTSFGGNENYISLTIVKNWYENFQRRLAADPNFWR